MMNVDTEIQNRNQETQSDRHSAPELLIWMGAMQLKIAEVYQARGSSAYQRYFESVLSIGAPWFSQAASGAKPLDLWRDISSYWLDFAQRSILFWDTLRERGNNWIEHEKAGKPPLLAFDWEMIVDGRTFERSVNYALVRIVPPEAMMSDPKRRPFVIIDPRAGHGPGIGGFKQDSQVGVALKAGHPVYCVIFFPDPMPGQALADVSLAEAEFLRIVGERHPGARKPVVVGNCQGGWASMLVGAIEPELVGPLVINGAPMSYWAGNDGENPMRYAGGILGGVWPALFVADLGSGKFDGAYLVDNFEYLNPTNTFFEKYYTLFSKIDTEPDRFLQFERWWGGFFFLDRKEINWIVQNLFIGNNLADGEAEWSEGRAFDLRAIRSPIIMFASLGDNITPPQQAFNWVADLYPTTEALKANGQVIVGMMHESVGHLGIFVSGQVAKREHAQIVDLIEYIEHLPPGLYGMRIEEEKIGGGVQYDVVLTERRVEDLHVLQKFGRRDEIPFKAVEFVSERLESAYEGFVHPALAAFCTPATASLSRLFHPQRAQRWVVSDLNPFLWPLKGMAAMAKAGRARRDEHGAMIVMERGMAATISASLDLYRDLRDAAVENAFFRVYGMTSFGLGMVPVSEIGEADEYVPFQEAPDTKEVLSHIADGDATRAIVRTALLLAKAGTGRRRLSAMKRVRELVGREAGLLDMPTAIVREIINHQSLIVDLEPDKALVTLPMLLQSAEERRRLLAMIDRLEGGMEINTAQGNLLHEIRKLLIGGATIGRKDEPISIVPTADEQRLMRFNDNSSSDQIDGK